MKREVTVTLGVLLGVSLVANVVLAARVWQSAFSQLRTPAAPQALAVEAPAPQAALILQVQDLREEIVRLRAQIVASPGEPGAPPPSPAAPAQGLVVPGSKGSAIISGLEAKKRLRDELRKLQDAKPYMEEADYTGAVLERVADSLGLEGAARGSFLQVGTNVRHQLAASDREYLEAARQAYHAAGKDWERTELPPNVRERHEAAQRAAQEQLRAHLDLANPRHRVFEKEELRSLVRLYLSRSGFSWSELEYVPRRGSLTSSGGSIAFIGCAAAGIWRTHGADACDVPLSAGPFG